MIRSLIEDIGLTQKEISEQSGVPQPAISRVYTGEQKEFGYAAGKAIEAFYLMKTSESLAAAGYVKQPVREAA